MPNLTALLSRPAPLPALVLRRDVGAAAWFALRRDGVVRPLCADVALRADLAESVELRAAALAHLVPARAVVGRRSAAWVHVGGAAPDRVELLFPPRSHRTDPDLERVAAEATLGAADVLMCGPVRVTTPLRTAIDVARFLPPAEATSIVTLLVAAGGVRPDELLAGLDRVGAARGVRRARRTLAAVVDRAATARADAPR